MEAFPSGSVVKPTTTILPFILRGVAMYGIDSVMLPKTPREEAWRRLGTDLPLDKLDSTVSEVGLSELMAVAPKILKGEVRGRVVVSDDDRETAVGRGVYARHRLPAATDSLLEDNAAQVSEEAVQPEWLATLRGRGRGSQVGNGDGESGRT